MKQTEYEKHMEGRFPVYVAPEPVKEPEKKEPAKKKAKAKANG